MTPGQAVATLAARLGEKPCRSGLATHAGSVRNVTREQDRGEPMRSVSIAVTLPEATNDPLTRINHRARARLIRRNLDQS